MDTASLTTIVIAISLTIIVITIAIGLGFYYIKANRETKEIEMQKRSEYFQLQYEYLQSEAVARGYGQYIVTPQGVTFEFFNNPCDEKISDDQNSK